MPEQPAAPEGYPFAITFIDPLFAVALHLGLSHGLFTEPWFNEWRLPTPDERMSIAAFILGLATLILAWLGYHQSIRRRPLKGLGRFAIDIVLVLLYAAMLVKFKRSMQCSGC